MNAEEEKIIKQSKILVEIIKNISLENMPIGIGSWDNMCVLIHRLECISDGYELDDDLIKRMSLAGDESKPGYLPQNETIIMLLKEVIRINSMIANILCKQNWIVEKEKEPA